MANKRRIPAKTSDFNMYLQVSADHLLKGASPVNWERLGLSAQENTLWQDYKTRWMALYPKYTSGHLRTRVITKEKNELMAAFTSFASPLLTRMSASPYINEADRATLRLPKRDRILTPRGRIEDVPMVSLEAGSGGRIYIRCRRPTEADRTSMHPLADGVEARYKIGGAEPASPNECTEFTFSKRSLFHFEAGQEHAGKRIYVYCRYVNLSRPQNSGAFSTWANVIVQG